MDFMWLLERFISLVLVKKVIKGYRENISED